MIFLNNELHIILKSRNLEICKFFYCLLNKIWSSDIQKLLYYSSYLTTTEIKVFKHNIQLISIKNPIFNVPLNIFLFNNLKKSNDCRFLNSYSLKWYEARCFKKNHLAGQIWDRSLDHVTKRRLWVFFTWFKDCRNFRWFFPGIKIAERKFTGKPYRRTLSTKIRNA